MNIEIGNVKLDLRLEVDPESGDVCLIANETVALIYIDKETGKLFRAHIPEDAVITVNPIPITGGYIEMEDELSDFKAIEALNKALAEDGKFERKNP